VQTHLTRDVLKINDFERTAEQFHEMSPHVDATNIEHVIRDPVKQAMQSHNPERCQCDAWGLVIITHCWRMIGMQPKDDTEKARRLHEVRR
jgi:hypothetical protein